MSVRMWMCHDRQHESIPQNAQTRKPEAYPVYITHNVNYYAYIGTVPFPYNTWHMCRAENMYVRMDLQICGLCFFVISISDTLYNVNCDPCGLVSWPG